MKQLIRLFVIAGVVGTLVLTAWSGVRAARGSGDKSGNPIPGSEFLSRILEVNVSSTDTGTETPDITGTPQTGNDNQDVQTETPEATEAHQVGEDHQGQDNQGPGTPEANGEVKGLVTALDASTITVDGIVYNLANFSEVKGTLQIGDAVKLEFVTNPDGTLTVREVKLSSQQGSSQDSNQSDGSTNGDQNSGNNQGSDHNGGSNSGSDGNGGSGGGNGGGDGSSGG